MIWTVLNAMFELLIYGTMIAIALLIVGCFIGVMLAVLRGFLALIFVLPLGIACGIYDLIQRGRGKAQ